MKKRSEAAQEISIYRYLALYSSMKCGKAQLSSSVVMTAGVLCMCWRSTVHSVISPAEKDHNYLPRGPVRSISTRVVLCCFLPHYTRFLRNTQKQETTRKLKTVQFLVEKKLRPQTLKCS